MLRSVGLAATFALAASSFLIPSTIDAEGFKDDVVKALPISTADSHHSLVDPLSQLIKLECPGCAYAQPKDDGLFWTQGVENSLVLNFTINDGRSFALNGVNLYPPNFGIEMTRLTVPQIKSDVALTEVREHPELVGTPLRVSGSGLAVQHATTVASGHEIIPITFEINALEHKPVSLPKVSIKLLKDIEGSLMIMAIDTVTDTTKPSNAGPGAAPDNKECKNLSPMLCKWRTILASKIAAMKASMHKAGGCAKSKGAHMVSTGFRPHSRPGHPGGLADGERPHHNHSHGPHRGPGSHPGPHSMHGHRHHKLARIMHKIGHALRMVIPTILSVLIPVLIGVAAGMTASLVGMAIGHAIAFMWIRFVRGGKKGPYERVAADDGEEAEEGVKEGEKMVYGEEAAQDAPPVYEDAPAYEMPAAEVVERK